MGPFTSLLLILNLCLLHPVISTTADPRGPRIVSVPNSDLIITMPEDLARRLDEILRRSADPRCPAASKLGYTSMTIRLSSESLRPEDYHTIPAALCSAVFALTQTPRGPLADLLLLPDHATHFQFRDPEAAHALNVAVASVTNDSKELADIIEQLANAAPMIFAIAYESIVKGKQLGSTIIIPRSELETSTGENASRQRCPYSKLQSQSPMCMDLDCKGMNVNKICQAETRYKHCDCWTKFQAIALNISPDRLDFIFVSLDMEGDGGLIYQGSKGQQLALASYVNPTSGFDLWNRMINYPSDKLSVLVANVLNGPDSRRNEDWAKVIDAAFAQGKTVIGYVRTGYLGVSKQRFKTMLGSTSLADWIAQIETDVELWYKLYPGKIGGIFFDEGWNECGFEDEYAEIYRLINENTKRKHSGAFTVLNPGDWMPACFKHSADTLMTYESNYANYFTLYKDNGWLAEDSRKLWHIIYDVPIDKIHQVVNMARQRGAGMLHVTDAVLPNPYDKLPSDVYMQTLLAAVQSGKPLIEEPRFVSGGLPSGGHGRVPPRPDTPTVTFSDYTSATVTWGSPRNAVAVVVYRFNQEVARVPAGLLRVTIGNLEQDYRHHRFSISAISKDGLESPKSDYVVTDTAALLNGKPIANIKIRMSDTQTIYEADVYIPYSFIRIHVTDVDSDCRTPSYPINTDRAFVCSHYMIEGETVYQYDGVAIDTKTKLWPWLWKPTIPLNGEGTNMKVERNGYHYTWYLPIGSSTMVTSTVVVQAEGFSPRTNVFVPQPCSWRAGGKVVKDSKTLELKYTEGQHKSCPYDCKADDTFNQCYMSDAKWCDQAAFQFETGPNSRDYFQAGSRKSGICRANAGGMGCKVEVRGKDKNNDGRPCSLQGIELFNAYRDIRNYTKGGCDKCGTKHFGNGCLVSIVAAECPRGELRYLDLNGTDAYENSTSVQWT